MLVGCKASEPTLLDKNAVQNVTSSYQGTIDALKENVIVKVSATVSHLFPEGYDSYNYSEAYSAYRQFGFVKNSDGTESRAVIDENGETYFEDTDGSTFFEKLDKTNKVKKFNSLIWEVKLDLIQSLKIHLTMSLLLILQRLNCQQRKLNLSQKRF